VARPAESDPPEIVPYLWRDVRAGELAIEAGANQGQSLARLGSLFSRVIAFEPYDAAWQAAVSRLRLGLGRNPDPARTDVRCQALSDHDGETSLRLVESQFRTDAHEAQEWHKTWHREPEIIVPCTTLDTVALLTRDELARQSDRGERGAPDGFPDFVNMDVEGSEAAILRGAHQVLHARRTSWLIEFHSQDLHDECLAILDAACSRTETVRHPHYERGSRLWYNHGWLLAHP
jgi:FkbM family methyltransferase